MALDGFYAAAQLPRAAADVVRAAAAERFGGAWRAAHPARAADVDAACARVCRYGPGLHAAAGSLGAECERELQEEQEREKEAGPERPAATPRAEVDWDLPAAASLAAAAALSAAVRLDAFIGRCLPADWSAVDWAPAAPALVEGGPGVWLTHNCAFAVEGGGGDSLPSSSFSDLSLFLRPVDFLLAFPCGSALLLSDREAERLLAAAWLQPQPPPPPSAPAQGCGGEVLLLQRCFARDPARSAWLATAARPGGRRGLASPTASLLPPRVLAQLQLFAGEANFGPPRRADAVGALLLLPSRARTGTACAAALALPAARGLGHTVSHSQLEAICEVVCEAGVTEPGQ